MTRIPKENVEALVFIANKSIDITHNEYPYRLWVEWAYEGRPRVYLRDATGCGTVIRKELSPRYTNREMFIWLDGFLQGQEIWEEVRNAEAASSQETMQYPKTISIKQVGWRIVGRVWVDLHGGGHGSTVMHDQYVPLGELTKERLLSCINDNGHGCESISAASIGVFEVYEGDYCTNLRQLDIINNPSRLRFAKRGI